MKRPIIYAALLGIVSAIALASPASADFHAYKDATYMGTHWQYDSPVNRMFYVGSDANDEITSFKNWRNGSTWFSKNYPVHVWDVNLLCESANSAATSLNNFRWQDGSNVNDSVSGIQLATGNPC